VRIQGRGAIAAAATAAVLFGVIAVAAGGRVLLRFDPGEVVYATRALGEMLRFARAERLAYIEVVVNPENVSSQRIFELNGGVLTERFTKPAQFGSTPGLRYRISL